MERCILFLCLLCCQVVAQQVRDTSFSLLVDIFNKNTDLFRRWSGSATDYETFMHELTPWMISERGKDLIVKERPVALNLSSVDCAASKYSTVLTGRILEPSNTRLIIDFIPFGYDVEKLEVRLYELFDVVDLFVLYEAPATQSGLTKPLFYQQLQHTPRFNLFNSKILYVPASEADIRSYREQTLNTHSFAMEQSMRLELIKRFQQALAVGINSNNNDGSSDTGGSNTYHLEIEQVKAKLLTIKERLPLAYGLQNDADEIPTGEVNETA